MSDQALSISTDKLNASNASRIRKTSESNSSMNAAPGLHTELRAAKRQEYEAHIRERDRKAEILKKELELEKLKRQQEEIQKIRNQRTFRSNPIKHYKPVEIKTSEKHLTEPVGPNLSTSQLRLNDISNNESSANISSSHRLSMALVDAPLIKKTCPKSRSHNSSSMASKLSKQRTVSQDNLRF